MKMKIETNASEIDDVKEICGSAKMNSEIVEIVCESEESRDAIVACLKNDEDTEDYANNSGVMEIWGTSHFGSNEQEYRIHVMSEKTRRENLGL
jgi:hypothetical protein